MNGKKSRKLRKMAESATIGSHKIDYFQGKPPVYQAQYEIGTNAFMGFVKAAKGIPAQLKRGCTRFVYKKMKQGFVFNP